MLEQKLSRCNLKMEQQCNQLAPRLFMMNHVNVTITNTKTSFFPSFNVKLNLKSKFARLSQIILAYQV